MYSILRYGAQYCDVQPTNQTNLCSRCCHNANNRSFLRFSIIFIDNGDAHRIRILTNNNVVYTFFVLIYQFLCLTMMDLMASKCYMNHIIFINMYIIMIYSD